MSTSGAVAVPKEDLDVVVLRLGGLRDLDLELGHTLQVVLEWFLEIALTCVITQATNVRAINQMLLRYPDLIPNRQAVKTITHSIRCKIITLVKESKCLLFSKSFVPSIDVWISVIG